MTPIEARQIAAELLGIVNDISYAELYPDPVNFIKARLRAYRLAQNVREMAEPHAAILSAGERRAAIVVERV